MRSLGGICISEEITRNMSGAAELLNASLLVEIMK